MPIKKINIGINLEIRNTKCTFDFMKDKKRYARSYKLNTLAYKKAMKRARKEKRKLANVIEHVVSMYANDAPAVVFEAIPESKKIKP